MTAPKEFDKPLRPTDQASEQWPTAEQVEAHTQELQHAPGVPRPSSVVRAKAPAKPKEGVTTEDVTSMPLNPKAMVDMGLGKMEVSQLDADLISIMGTLQQQQCDNIVVIGLSPAGEIVTLRRQGKVNNPYAMIGALEALKAAFIARELAPQAVVAQAPTQTSQGPIPAPEPMYPQESSK